MPAQPPAIGARVQMELQRRSTATEVADILRGLIFSGEIAAGAPLREAQLATSIGVSRQVVREALFQLQNDGLVERLPYKGTSVRTITATGVTDLFNVRVMIEMTAVDAVIGGDDADRERVAAAARAFTEVDRADAWPQVIETDFRFHLSLVNALHSPRTTTFYETLQGELRLCSAMTNQGQYTVRDYTSSHTAIAEAITDRDRKRARKLLLDHLALARDDVLAALGTDPSPAT